MERLNFKENSNSKKKMKVFLEKSVMSNMIMTLSIGKTMQTL